jgi:hypothetical protein
MHIDLSRSVLELFARRSRQETSLILRHQVPQPWVANETPAVKATAAAGITLNGYYRSIEGG